MGRNHRVTDTMLRLARGGLGLHHSRRVKKVGLPPGTLVYTGPAPDRTTQLSTIVYSADAYERKEVASVEEALEERARGGVTWINVVGLADPGPIEALGEHFGIDRLLLEDLVSVGQRPKVEIRDEYLFLVLRMFMVEESNGAPPPSDGQRDAGRRSGRAATTEPEEIIRQEQVSMILGPDFLLTFQEREGDVFDPVRTRLRDGKGRLRGRGADYLAYALFDTIVDHFFVVLEVVGDRVDSIEEMVLGAPDPEVVHLLYRLRREVMVLRRSVWPLRELLGQLLREDSELIREDTRPFLRDVQDHAVEVIETVEGVRDVAGGLLDTHLSMVSHRMNEVMKVLTMIATIFVPLTFVVGIYGMNFTYMPELDIPWAYPTVLAVMAAITAGMVVFFHRKGWL